MEQKSSISPLLFQLIPVITVPVLAPLRSSLCLWYVGAPAVHHCHFPLLPFAQCLGAYLAGCKAYQGFYQLPEPGLALPDIALGTTNGTQNTWHVALATALRPGKPTHPLLSLPSKLGIKIPYPGSEFGRTEKKYFRYPWNQEVPGIFVFNHL